MSYDFFKLPIELQDWFLNKKVQPMSKDGANNTISSYLQQYEFKDIIVKLNTPLKCKDGTLLDEVTIKSDDLYPAFLPEVWPMLSLEQRIQVIALTYGYIISNDKTLKHNPPKLEFFDDKEDDYFGTYTSDDNVVTLRLSKMLFMEDGFDIPSFIIHELTHAKQKIERDELIESKKPIKKMSAREVAIIFESTGSYLLAFDFFKDLDEEFLKEHVVGFCNITEQDIDQIKNNQESPDALWSTIFKLPYLCHPMEIEAFRTQNYFRNKMIDGLSEKFDVHEQKHTDEFDRVIDLLKSKTNSKCGYDLNDKTLENLVILNYALGSTIGKDYLYGNDETAQIVCSGMKTLVDLYNNKQIDDKLDFLDYDKLLELKQEQLDKKDQKQDTEFKTKQ